MTVATIVVDDKDDEPDAFDTAEDPDDELDDEDDELDEDPDDAEPEGEPDGKSKPKPKPTYKDLLAEVAKLREGNSRNNRELMNRRHLAEFMKTHQIANLDQWLADLGVDRETGQLREGANGGSPAATEPTADTTGARDQGAPPEAAPGAPEATDVEAEVARRVRLELAKQAAKDNPSPPDEPDVPDRASVLETKAKLREVELALTRAGFNGKFDVAQRVLNMAGVQVDANGEVSGAEAAVQELREEIPEWFRRATVVRTPPAPRGGESVDGGDKKPPAGKQPGWEEKIVASWQRGR